MPKEAYVHTAGDWHKVKEVHNYTNGSWRKDSEGYVYTGGQHKKWWPSITYAEVDIGSGWELLPGYPGTPDLAPVYRTPPTCWWDSSNSNMRNSVYCGEFIRGTLPPNGIHFWRYLNNTWSLCTLSSTPSTDSQYGDNSTASFFGGGTFSTGEIPGLSFCLDIGSPIAEQFLYSINPNSPLTLSFRQSLGVGTSKFQYLQNGTPAKHCFGIACGDLAHKLVYNFGQRFTTSANSAGQTPINVVQPGFAPKTDISLTGVYGKDAQTSYVLWGRDLEYGEVRVDGLSMSLEGTVINLTPAILPAPVGKVFSGGFWNSSSPNTPSTFFISEDAKYLAFNLPGPDCIYNTSTADTKWYRTNIPEDSPVRITCRGADCFWGWYNNNLYRLTPTINLVDPDNPLVVPNNPNAIFVSAPQVTAAKSELALNEELDVNISGAVVSNGGTPQYNVVERTGVDYAN